MTAPRTRFEMASATLGPAERVRAALASETEGIKLYRAISAVVGSLMKGRPRDQVAQRVTEVFNETALRALARPETLRPGSPTVPWLIGIARNVVHGDTRAASGRTRRTVPFDPGDQAWDRLTADLEGNAPADARMDVEAMLARLDPAARLAIECRFLRGLSGRELADALGAPNAGAARVRVARAKQELLDLFDRSGSEVDR